MDGADDLAAIDALQVDAGDPEVGVPELALDHDQRNAFVRHLDRVGMTQLVRREPPSHPCRGGGGCSCLRAADASQRRPAVGPWITHSTAPIGSWRRISSHGQLLPRPAVHPDLAALAALAAPDEHGAAGLSRSALLERERLADP